LGEQGLWTKANNYELSTRVPLILSVPGQAHAGATTDALVEFVDVYPTLADVCGLDAPAAVEGISLKPLLDDPDRPWKQAVFSQYPRARKDNRHRGHGDFMGYAVRTERYRYVEWREWGTGRVAARELYDHERDPNEMHNAAAEPGQSAIVRHLAGVLEAGWKAAGPERPRPNVLFLALDDMKDWVRCLGGYEGTVHTPNIDRLGKRGMLFTNAHCASPKCAPSRAAIMTGLRPSTTGLYDNG
ncbi:unnamed protein product, partial [marine sediment metagenome]